MEEWHTQKPISRWKEYRKNVLHLLFVFAHKQHISIKMFVLNLKILAFIYLYFLVPNLWIRYWLHYEFCCIICVQQVPVNRYCYTRFQFQLRLKVCSNSLTTQIIDKNKKKSTFYGHSKVHKLCNLCMKTLLEKKMFASYIESD